jgi:large subunit ribosomal protein L18
MKTTTLLKNQRRLRRERHVRSRIRREGKFPRLSVYRSCKHIYAQVIDDATGRTLAHASSTAGTLEPAFAGKNKTQRAAVVGEEIAKAAKQAGVERVVFDRGFAKFHGRVKALAEAARAAGLKF